MAYSIYFYFKPEVLEVLDSKTPILSFTFAEDWQRKVLPPESVDVGKLFGWVKPRGDRAKEKALFKELASVLPFLLEVAADDDHQSEMPLRWKLIDCECPELVPYIGRAIGEA
jgi:hypothetical protein